MVYKKIQNPEGDYKDVQNVRWDVLEAHEAWTPEGMNVGWDAFESLEEAAGYYGLMYDHFIPEEELDNQEEID
jgi:hypothetical protein